MPDIFDFGHISEQIRYHELASHHGFPDSGFLQGDSNYTTYTSYVFRDIDEHLKECRFFNGLSISRSRNTNPRRREESQRDQLVFLHCSCGWRIPIDHGVYNMRYRGVDFEDIIADTNYRLLNHKAPLRFADEIKNVLDSYKRSERRQRIITYKEAKSRFSKPLEGLEI